MSFVDYLEIQVARFGLDTDLTNNNTLIAANLWKSFALAPVNDQVSLTIISCSPRRYIFTFLFIYLPRQLLFIPVRITIYAVAIGNGCRFCRAECESVISETLILYPPP